MLEAQVSTPQTSENPAEPPSKVVSVPLTLSQSITSAWPFTRPQSLLVVGAIIAFVIWLYSRILQDLLIGIAFIIALTLWWLPIRQAALSAGFNEENSFDRENEARKTLAQIVGGVLVLAGLYSSVKTFDLQRQSGDLQRQSADTQREGQITDRFTKAIDQLGALAPGGGTEANGQAKINLVVRLGGIYALERIARDSPKDHWTIMEVLTTYVRENAYPLNSEETLAASPLVRADVQSVLTVLGRRNITRDPVGQLDLNHANLNGSDLILAHMEGANLSFAQLRKAKFYQAYLSKTEFIGANLDEADFYNADLAGADLSYASLKGADFSSAHNIKPEQLDKTTGDEKTKLPPEIANARPVSWGK